MWYRRSMPRRVYGGFIQFLDQYPDGVAPPGHLILCGGCRERHPPSEFYVARAIRLRAEGKRITGTSQRCRRCASRSAARFRAPKIAVIDEARKVGCADCGLVDLDHPEIFDFDHVRGEKIYNVATLVIKGTLDELRDELAKCDVVCANCHRKRTRSRAPVTRGRDGRKPSRTRGALYG
jgi:hypothetical protein